ncbi:MULTISPECIES: type III pantothenate kinase [Acetobacter]|uniref:Type III pantothenate kinase n=1 Tax=Acetobacter thailandicus TaxID=1502842 RepID=A0ABT3QAR6_9PROT|nr:MULTISPECIES: type III pantothenate kinase [Acetobacter]MBS0959438.1 type III pantothenate kinase [Acetobacter thailandicus]MBS0980625.1 type III pantothenate kinase [Acetobacter thailandicus]MBS0984669.1 type III pantothenate kinase [Acetobacter thailandicus]MBS1003812.1 type III pantothenate kinase [Acetobacter thailandicus]MCX2562377.1 type III pantothenate kinase [Acetobacter thailandicus]
MLLVIDAGNTNVVFAVYDGAAWRGSWRITTSSQRTSDEYAVWLLTLLSMSGIAREDINGAVIGTVVPAALYHLRALCRQWFSVEPLLASVELNWGIEVKMDTPEEVGVDRLLNSLAAHHYYGGPLTVIDFGTATTFDVVDGEGNYCGGVIAPGINLSVEALHKAAARLPRIGVGRPVGETVVGRNTVSAMRSGVFWGYLGLIEGIVERIRREVGQPMKVLATGGLAPLFSEGTKVFDHVDSMLTLNGLRILAERNALPRFITEKDSLA